MLYEIDLSCGDTISSAVAPRIGAYRTCIHCDSRKRVTGIREPVTLLVPADSLPCVLCGDTRAPKIIVEASGILPKRAICEAPFCDHRPPAIECCGNVGPYPTTDVTRRCPTCGTTYAVAEVDGPGPGARVSNSADHVA